MRRVLSDVSLMVRLLPRSAKSRVVLYDIGRSGAFLRMNEELTPQQGQKCRRMRQEATEIDNINKSEEKKIDDNTTNNVDSSTSQGITARLFSRCGSKL